MSALIYAALQSLAIAEVACKNDWEGKTDVEKRQLIKEIDWLQAPEAYRAAIKVY